MNPWTLEALTHSHQTGLRHLAALTRHPSDSGLDQPTPVASVRSRLTEFLGHTLVEAGLHLLATATPRA